MACDTVTGSACVAQGEDWADSISLLNPDGSAVDVTGWVVSGGVYQMQNGGPAPGATVLLSVGTAAPGYVTLTSADTAPQFAILVPRAAIAAALADAGAYWLQLFFDDAAGVRRQYLRTSFNLEPSGGF